jgi:hypothetical protein
MRFKNEPARECKMNTLLVRYLADAGAAVRLTCFRVTAFAATSSIVRRLRYAMPLLAMCTSSQPPYPASSSRSMSSVFRGTLFRSILSYSQVIMIRSSKAAR